MSKWTQALKEFTDINVNAPTHFIRASGIASRLDRILLGSPSYYLQNKFIEAKLLATPEALTAQFISDHAP
eukprot:1719762-Lingulodinium_polyedra.AAC.1